MPKIKNAIIDAVSLNIERGVFLTSWLHLKYGDSSGQGFGGFVLHKEGEAFKDTKFNYGGHYLTRCMQIAGVDSWKDMPGKAIRVEYEGESFNMKILAIGHITKDDWFNPSKDFNSD